MTLKRVVVLNAPEGAEDAWNEAAHLADGIEFTRRHPAFARAIGAYALSSVIGQLFVYYTITEFDSLVLSTVTTTRKIFSTLYSVFRDPSNTLSTMQWSGCGMVFLGIFIAKTKDFFCKLFRVYGVL